MALRRGTSLKDRLIGTSVADQMFGFGGDDFIAGGAGNDTIDGGTGNDELSGGGDNDNLFGNTGNDKIFGGDGHDTLNGGIGDDTLTGGAGNDTYIVDAASDKVIESSGIDLVRTTVSLALASGVEAGLLLGTATHLSGNTLANKLTGNGLGNALSGGAGNDTLAGGAGNDTLIGGAGGDRFEGGVGTDTVSYVAESSGVSIFLDNSTAASGNAFFDTFFAIENVLGSRFGDFLSGTSIANTLTGGGGDDVLFGRGGLDQLLGGDGDDVLLPGADLAADIINGGDGKDTVSYQDATERVGISLESNLSDFGADNDVYISIENVIGTELDFDAIQVAGGGAAFGLGGADTLEGSRTTGLANQTTEFLTGGNGVDTFLVHRGTGADALLDFDGLIAGDNIFFFGTEFAATFGVLTTEGSVNATIASAQFIYERLTDTLYFDQDGTVGGFAPELIAYLPDLGPSAVLTSDFFIVV